MPRSTVQCGPVVASRLSVCVLSACNGGFNSKPKAPLDSRCNIPDKPPQRQPMNINLPPFSELVSHAAFVALANLKDRLCRG